MVLIGYGRRLVVLAAVAVVTALPTLAAPASALTVTIPTVLPTPLPPVQLPVGGSVTVGTGGDPTGVTVTVPNGSGVDVQLPGVPNLPALPALPTLPVGPTGPVSVPPVTTPPLGPVPGTPATPASPSPGGSSDPSVSTPGDKAVTLKPSAPQVAPNFAAAAARPAGPAGTARDGRVNAEIDARPADSLLHRIPTIATRLALWIALAALVFAIHMLVSSGIRHHRRKAARVS